MIRCNLCDAVMINRVFCHEFGCPNQGKRYDAENNIWVKVRECKWCGNIVDMEDVCCENSN